MNKFKLKIFLKAAYEMSLVFLQFLIISLHFFQWEFIPQKQIIIVNPFSYFVGFLIFFFKEKMKSDFIQASVKRLKLSFE